MTEAQPAMDRLGDEKPGLHIALLRTESPAHNISSPVIRF